MYDMKKLTHALTLTHTTHTHIYTQAGKFLTQTPIPPMPADTKVPEMKRLGHDALLLGKLFSFILKPILGGVDGSGTACDLQDALVASAAASTILFVIPNVATTPAHHTPPWCGLEQSFNLRFKV